METAVNMAAFAAISLGSAYGSNTQSKSKEKNITTNANTNTKLKSTTNIASKENTPKLSQVKTNQTVPNPNGKKGGELHQQKIKEVEKNIVDRGFETKREYQIKTPGGTKNTRYADIVAVDKNKKVIEIHQVGKQNLNGTPVSREVKAINDIKGSKDYKDTKIIYHPYNKVVR